MWFLARNKNPGEGQRDRRGEVLFIDARKLGHMVDRTRREFSDEVIASIVGCYQAWRQESDAGSYQDKLGFCKVSSLAEISEHNHALTPGRYVGAAATEDDDGPFAERLAELKETLDKQFAEAELLSAVIQTKIDEISMYE